MDELEWRTIVGTYERFGWVTHHHGGWIHHNSRWYWRPPPRGRWRHVPWYPARVAWVHSGRHIGWVPISPYEAYYGRRYWGPRSVVYHNNIRHVEFRRYVNANRVIVVDKDRLYGVHRRYETTRDARVVKEIVNNGRAAPVVTRDVVGTNTKMEHHFARSGDFSRKPNTDAATEFAGRRRGSAGATATAQTPAPGIQKTSIKAPDTKTGPTPAVKPGEEGKRNLPDTPRELRREQRQEQRLEKNTGKSVKEAPGPGQQGLPQQQKQQQVREQQQQQQRPQQAAQQGRQQQFERQQQHQLMQEQQRAQRQQQQAQRQQQVQAAATATSVGSAATTGSTPATASAAAAATAAASTTPAATRATATESEARTTTTTAAVKNRMIEGGGSRIESRFSILHSIRATQDTRSKRTDQKAEKE